MRKLNRYRIDHSKFIGFKVGNLTVISFNKILPRKSGTGNHYYYDCLCVCGNKTIATKHNLLASKKRSINSACKTCNNKIQSEKNKNKKPKWNSDLDRKIALVYSEYNTRAVKKQIEITLTHNDFKELCLQNCYYCNISPKEYRRSKDKPKTGLMRLNFNGLDRLDSTKGYTKNNVVVCCEDCNKAKRNLEHNEFLILIKQIYENRIANNDLQSNKSN